MLFTCSSKFCPDKKPVPEVDFIIYKSCLVCCSISMLVCKDQVKLELRMAEEMMQLLIMVLGK